MQKRYVFLFISSILLTLFVLYSCNEPNVVENKKIEKQEKPVLSKATRENNSATDVTTTGKFLGYKVVKVHGKEVKVPFYEGDPNRDIQPDKMQCNDYFEYVWSFDHYTTKGDKWLGIWPYSYSISVLKDFKNKWGYIKVVVSTGNYNNAISAGDSADDIMITLPTYSSYQNIVQKYNAKYYYIDEPLRRGTYSKEQLVEIANYIASVRSNSGLMISTFWYNPYLGPPLDLLYVVNHTSNAYIQCDQYDGDQRGLWTGFHQSIGDRNPSDWVNTVRDGVSEFNQLFAKANNLNLKSLWLYTRDGNHDAIGDFSDYAWQNGFLRRFDHLYRYYWHCYFPGDPCYCQSHPEEWHLVRIDDMQQEKEVYY